MHTFFFLPVLCLVVFVHTAQAQFSPQTKEWLNPQKNIAVVKLHDQLMLIDVASQDVRYRFPGRYPDAQVKFGPHDAQLLIYGGYSGTQLYQLGQDSCIKIADFPLMTESAAFSHSGERLYLLHSRTWKGARLSAYDTNTGLEIHARKVSSLTNALSVHQDDSLIGLSSDAMIRLLHAGHLQSVKVFWETQKQYQLTFNPALPMQVASVTGRNIIQLRDLAKDTLLAEIGAHQSPIVFLVYDPSGKYLISLDEIGNLFAWSLSQKQRVMQSPQVYHTPVFDAEGRLHWHNGQRWTSTQLSDDAFIDPSDSLRNAAYFLQKEQRSFDFLPQPLITYTPETRMLYGVNASMIFYPKSPMRYPLYYRPSTIVPTVAYAPSGKQLITSIDFDLYSQTGWRFVNKIAYNIRDRNFFFGIGGDARRGDRQAYFTNSFSLHGDILKNVSNALRIGIAYNFRKDTAPDFAEEATDYTGARGGWLSGIGPIVQYDKRDNMVYPTRGGLLDTRLYFYERNLQSDFQYHEIILNYSKYIPLKPGEKQHVLAIQGFVDATWGGDVPFYQLPHLTADRVLRGVWRNLYIDKQVAYLQAEFRSFFVSHDNRFGYVLFVGAGDGAENFLHDYPNPNLKIAYGAGFRQQLVPKLRLDSRIDFAITNKGDFGIFGGIGVAF